MAQVRVPTSASVGVTATRQPMQNINAPALAFSGVAAGEAFHELGSAVGDVANDAHRQVERFQAINNKVATDQRSVDYDTTSNNTLREFQESNPGMKAYENRQTLFDTLEEQRKAGADGLSPDAQVMYNSATRAQLGRMVSNYSSWAAGQRNSAIDATYTAVVDGEKSKAAADPAYTPKAKERIYAEVGAQAGIKGWSDEVAGQVLREQVGSMYQGQIVVAVNAGDYPQAESLFEAHSAEMTDDQIKSVSSSMKVGRNAFEANLAADQVVAGLGGPEGQVDPLASLKAAAPGATITSGKRSAADNARVGGVANSDHLTGEAADFVPAHGQTMAQLATSLRSAGIGEVINEGNHIHVEWGKGAGSKRATTKLEATTDPELWEAHALREIKTQMAERFPNNPGLRAAAESAARARVADEVRIRNAENKGRYTKLLSAITEGNIQSEAGIVQAYPGATSDLATLPPTYQMALQNATKGNANQMTPERYLKLNELNGMRAAATDLTAPWFRTDIAKSGLPPGTQVALMKQQETDRAEVQKRAGKLMNDTTVQKMLKTPVAQSAMESLGIKHSGAEDADNTAYFQFTGALSAYVENYQATHDGKSPDQKAMDTIVSQVTATVGAKPGGWFGIGATKGTPRFAVPDTYRQQAIDAAAKLGINLTDVQVSAAYQRSLNRGQ